ncbi:4-hydroxythreonine-4-phosphate dehydrogenase [Kiloniella litopenaei]|uniref:4-hydroxythreonine-4-phosphate dehydrogenase n=1 Tax=Kiloniella litopenaei TaxID=1549748 RepID=A0A0M2RFH3_9PROT|nr:4-hydroxythreonine-4-phosphate dehydrogenase PdxA [Kiloniella litopenaei]KKJ78298.1 4-hydroxythreonine-4-phosphate dehydrogenase [Kiloniella litopenaei]
MKNRQKPLAITMGDPSGIGPEIVVASLSKSSDGLKNIVFGCPKVMERAVKLSQSDLVVRVLDQIDEAEFSPGVIEVLQTSCFDTLPPFGSVNAVCGKAAYDAIVQSIRHAVAGRVSGIVTAPIHKEALSAAGISYPGHTEILADLGGAERVAMLLGNDEVRTVLVTVHCSLSEAIKRGDYAAQIAAIRLAHEGAIALGFKNPRVAVAGLNPHAGEGGLFGREEIEIISPAIKAAQKEGINVSGPWPGDTVFMQARKGQFDIVVAQYHDQGLIPVKYMGLEKGVNITLGLPFVRTSPDHGTAFDIAGQGIADSASLETAIKYANQLVRSKMKDTA